ncbi:MAG: hypothetical protein A4S09_03790 [Proteobacteria bacterium SG_bin7]|nr:MAG: hypothetical protein A4S09_03790 [Proteobacteria bacterium SG_bin7]
MRNLIFLFVLLVTQTARACPFCDYGGTATAIFIVTFLGFISLGMFALFLAHKSSGGFKDSEETSYKVFEAEGERHES